MHPPADTKTPTARADPNRPNGATIRAIRQVKGLLLEDLAKQVGISIGYLSRIERGGRAGKRQTEDIARVLDVDVDVLLGRKSAVGVLRQLLGITVDDLMLVTRRSRDDIDRIEQGAELPDPNLLAVIANRFGVAPAAIRPHLNSLEEAS